MLKLKNPCLLVNKALVGGEWIEAPNGKRLDVRDPADGTVIGQVPDLGASAVKEAIDHAFTAQRAWARQTVKTRSAVLKRWFDLIAANADDLALILTSEQGKPLQEAKAEVLGNAAYIEWFAEEAKRIIGDVLPGTSGDQRALVLKQPIGVCAAITPWNFPNGMIVRKVAPALAAGCSIILKPAAQTPLSALALAVLAEQAGVPPCVFSVVTGEAEPIGRELCHNPKVAKITFTGSTKVGRWLMKEAADSVKKVSMELDGNAPFIVFDDADLDAAVDGAMLSKFRNSGQTCVCANRIYVQAGVLAEFTAKLAAKVQKLIVGRGTDREVTQGPLINRQAVEKIEEHIADALENGATVITGGKRSSLGGNFFEPTVISGVTHSMKVTREETFAPLAPIIPFTSEDEVIALANETEYGLAGYFYSNDVRRVWRIAEELEVGMVGVNTGVIATEMAPFGGIKQSGIGREGSKYGIEGFLELKYVCLGGM